MDETLELEPGEEEFGSGKVFAADVMVPLCTTPCRLSNGTDSGDRLQNQIFDLIRPKHPRVITLDDLISSGAAHIFTSILLSRCLVFSLRRHEQRATLLMLHTPGICSTTGSTTMASGLTTIRNAARRRPRFRRTASSPSTSPRAVPPLSAGPNPQHLRRWR